MPEKDVRHNHRDSEGFFIKCFLGVNCVIVSTSQIVKMRDQDGSYQRASKSVETVVVPFYLHANTILKPKNFKMLHAIFSCNKS